MKHNPRHSAWIYFVAVSVSLLGLAGVSSAALDPERTTPYHLRVVLHLGESRLLTDVFRERVERGLQDYLQAAFGPLARVEVVRTHPKLPDVLEQGLQRSLDNWRERSATKTHFVLIDYVNGHYEIQSRQHDGLTGQPSPIVRIDRTRDRAFAARAAAFVVEKDFGIVATFNSWPGNADAKREPPLPVTIQLKGSGLGVPLSRWVQKGDVFKVLYVPAAGNEIQEIPYALLRVKESPSPDGNAVCDLFWRYAPPSEANLAGYRCLKIATIRAPLRLRITEKDADNRPPKVPTGLRVEARRNGFQETNPLQDNLDTFGSFDSSKPKFGDKGSFDDMVLVSLFNGLTPRARFPVALVDDQPRQILLEATSGDGGFFGLQRMNWKREVADSYLVLNNLFKDLQAGTAKPEQRADTLKWAREGILRCRADYLRLTAEREELLKSPEAKPSDRATLAFENKMLESLQEGERTLKNFVDQQEKNLKEQNDPERLALLNEVQGATLLEKKAEYGKALEIYEKAAANEKIKIGGVKERADLLRERWQIKSPKHAEARAFIYKTFPTLDTPGLDARMKDAREALKECKNAGDGLTPHRLLLAIETLVPRLHKELKPLNPINIDDESKIATIGKVTKELTELAEEAQAAIKPLGDGK